METIKTNKYSPFCSAYTHKTKSQKKETQQYFCWNPDAEYVPNIFGPKSFPVNFDFR